jgi:hypothetical protein
MYRPDSTSGLVVNHYATDSPVAGLEDRLWDQLSDETATTSAFAGQRPSLAQR